MGVGHRVYKVKDPRAFALQGLAAQLFKEKGEHPLYKVAQEVEAVINEHVGARGIASNVDFYSGVVYDKIGIPIDQFTPIFAIARVVGWLAHWAEESRTIGFSVRIRFTLACTRCRASRIERTGITQSIEFVESLEPIESVDSMGSVESLESMGPLWIQ